MTKTALTAVCNVEPISKDGSYPEGYDLQALKSYVHGSPCRETNVMIMIEFYESLLKAYAKRRGRRRESDKDRQEEYNRMLTKLRNSEQMCKQLLEMLDKSNDQTASKKRKLVKSPSSADPHDQRSGPQKLSRAQVTYRYSMFPDCRSRRYVVGIGAQSLSRRMQRAALNHTIALDQENSSFVIFDQVLGKLDMADLIPTDVRNVIRDCAIKRDYICEELLHVDASTGKQILSSVLHGGQIRQPYEKNEFLVRLQKASIYLRWLACALMPEAYEYYCQQPDKKFPEATVLHHFYTVIEDCIMSSWCEFIREDTVQHLSLHFDGIRVDADHRNAGSPDGVKTLISTCEDHIAEATGFNVKIKVKKHLYFIELIHLYASKELALIHEVFKKKGNCIPISLAHITGEYDHIQKVLSDINNPLNLYADTRNCRTYTQAQQMTSHSIVPHPGFANRADGHYLLHSEHDGNPHCVAVAVTSGQTEVVVFDGEDKYAITWKDFLRASADAIDKATIITYYVSAAGADAKWPDDIDKEDAKRLLDIQAAGKAVIKPSLKRPAASLSILNYDADSSDDDACDLNQLNATHPDDESVVVVGDKLLSLLRNEVKQVSKLRKFTPPDHCPFCPWRRFQHRADRVRHHISTYHVASTQYCCSGTKQIKIIIALYDNDVFLQQAPCNLLRRSAAILRQSVHPGLDSSRNDIDRYIRLVIDNNGVNFVNAESVVSSLSIRRVGNLMYTKGFAVLLFKEVLVHNCKIAAVIPRLMMHMHAAGSELGNLLPTHHRYWWPLVEDIFWSPGIQALKKSLMDELETYTEYTSISMDATLRCCMSILGQAHHRESAASRANSAFDDASSIRRVLSVRGRTGAVVALLPLISESSDCVSDAMDGNLSRKAKDQVRFIACDNPSTKLLASVSKIFPSLEIMCLDPVHLPIVYEYSTWST
jgi:hypothetical protein